MSRTSVYLATTLARGPACPTRSTRPCAIGQQITVHAEILYRLDRPVHLAADVPVYLGQIIYSAAGAGQFSQALINDGQEGQTPVSATPTADGVATFRIRSPVGGSNPVYFEANLVNPTDLYPYGYSPIPTVGLADENVAVAAMAAADGPVTRRGASGC